MPTEVIVAVITVLGTSLSAFLGVIVSSRLTVYRIEQLEKKVDKHNTLVERLTKVEFRLDNLEKND